MEVTVITQIGKNIVQIRTTEIMQAYQLVECLTQHSSSVNKLKRMSSEE